MLTFRNADLLALQLKKRLQSFSIDSLAMSCGFVKRKPRKIHPLNFLLAFFIMVLTGGHSLSTFATTIGLISSIRISKQAVHKRINQSLLVFLKSILENALLKSIHWDECAQISLSSKFNRILIQDSTNIQLDPKLSQHFPGSKNQNRKATAIMKIQTIYDLFKESFYSFDISGFTKNDQKASSDILKIISKGDLLIRDLGYFVLPVIKNLGERGAFFLSRLKFGILIYQKDGKTLFNLYEELKKHNTLDVNVIIGSEHKVPVRLVALPVSETVAAERRRKAKSNRDRRLNPNKEYLALLGWNIYVLNVDCQTLTTDQIPKLYKLRWRIEIIFKTWKSHFHLTNVPKASVLRVNAYIYAMLTFITLFQTHIFARLYKVCQKKTDNQLSLFKLTRFCKEQIWAIILFSSQLEKIETQILYHCKYESRKKRMNHIQRVFALS